MFLKKQLEVCRTDKIKSSEIRIHGLPYDFQDLFCLLLELRWRWIFLLYTLSNLITWILFALCWWLIAQYHDDLPSSDSGNGSREHEQCVVGIDNFASSFLFSMEVQTTTGFGVRAPSPLCYQGIILFPIQTIFGTLLSGVMLGIVFVKAARPTGRSKSIIFSQNMVICTRDGITCLLFRVADIRKSKLLSVKLKVYLLAEYVTQEGEIIKQYQRRLKVSVDEAGSDVILASPLTVCHRINSSSPFLNAFVNKDLGVMQTQFEIVVSLSGVLDSTGQTVEARTTYTPAEIHWGHRFSPILTQTSDGIPNYQIDYECFDKITPVNMPIDEDRRQISDPSNEATLKCGE